MIKANQVVTFISDSGLKLQGEVIECNDHAARILSASGLYVVDIDNVFDPERITTVTISDHSGSVSEESIEGVDDEVIFRAPLNPRFVCEKLVAKARPTVSDLRNLKSIPISPKVLNISLSEEYLEEWRKSLGLSINFFNPNTHMQHIESDVVKKSYIDDIILKSINSGLDLEPVQEDGNMYGWISDEKGNRERVLVSTPTNDSSIYDSKLACPAVPLIVKSNFDALLADPNIAGSSIITRHDSSIRLERYVKLKYNSNVVHISESGLETGLLVDGTISHRKQVTKFCVTNTNYGTGSSEQWEAPVTVWSDNNCLHEYQLNLICSTVYKTSKSWVLVLHPQVEMLCDEDVFTLQFRDQNLILIKG